MDVYLHSFRHVLPLHYRKQDELVAWTIKAHQEAAKKSGTQFPDERLLKRFCLNSRQIAGRFFESPDMDEDWDNHQVDILDKNNFFDKRAEGIFLEFYPHNDHVPDHLIHVTCTGYISPSAPQKHFENLINQPAITHAYHMGCYASLPAIRLGLALVKSQDSKIVEIVHTEMCSLHMDLHNHGPEQMVVQTLFADGHIAYALSSSRRQKSFRILSVREKLVKDSAQDMKWIPSSFGMKMTLSREVPSKIQKDLPELLKSLAQEMRIPWETLQKKAIFAIHPGGPKIIEAAQQMLGINDDQVAYSKKILLERGNMSSATLPHVWEEILNSGVRNGQLVVSLAFGPGLTIFASVFEVVEG